MRRFKVTVTTASDGTATAYTPRVAGKLCAIHYVKTDFAEPTRIYLRGHLSLFLIYWRRSFSCLSID